VQGERTVF